MAYPFYSNQFYMNDLQQMRDKIDNQIKQLQIQQQNQTQQIPQPITQNFQLAPNTTNNEVESKYVNSIDDVKNTFVMKTGVFVNKDFSTLWIKDVSGKIRTFETLEVIEMDEKDKEIINLKRQIEEMKGMILNANESEHNNSIVNEPNANEVAKRVSTNKKGNGK